MPLDRIVGVLEEVGRFLAGEGIGGHGVGRFGGLTRIRRSDE
jgi:hypothetical protein